MCWTTKNHYPSKFSHSTPKTCINWHKKRKQQLNSDEHKLVRQHAVQYEQKLRTQYNYVRVSKLNSARLLKVKSKSIIFPSRNSSNFTKLHRSSTYISKNFWRLTHTQTTIINGYLISKMHPVSIICTYIFTKFFPQFTSHITGEELRAPLSASVHQTNFPVPLRPLVISLWTFEKIIWKITNSKHAQDWFVKCASV